MKEDDESGQEKMERRGGLLSLSFVVWVFVVVVLVIVLGVQGKSHETTGSLGRQVGDMSSLDEPGTFGGSWVVCGER